MRQVVKPVRAVFHFALDPQVARADYAPRKATVPSATTGKVGRVEAPRAGARRGQRDRECAGRGVSVR